ncbi:MAG: hypothetical protein ACD_3C00111G0024 [uncultured bacterium (gcode 4)]|uniref:Uncharacterized protein n=1 Tax=uncultured bacterium (gcode 4) TaxID=1234023 RepID=K2G1B9_9BACT|nr:MAG: hypothetical protein ACD_3C00111G0024 [uncultured bacterium (gcode 4)]
MSKSTIESIWCTNSRVLESQKTSSLTEKISQMISLALKNPELAIPLLKLDRICSKNDLSEWEWIYESYFFSGNSWNLNIDNARWFPNTSDISLFTNWGFLENLLKNWLDFDSDPEARKRLHNLISKMISQIDISNESVMNLNRAINKAGAQGKKLVILANHISHFDAPFLDYAFTEKLLKGKDMDVRLVCWAFMYYNSHVRPFVKCFNTTFVFWPADSRDMMETIRQNDKRNNKGDFKLFRPLKNMFEATISSNGKNEITILFPYAWRSDISHSNYVYWCKDEIDPSMKPLLTLPGCIYLPLWMRWPWELFPGNPRWWWNMIENLANSKKTYLNLEFSSYFEWWELWPDEIHDAMVNISKKSFR